jgi:Flp pilus assembly protein CpaB
MCWKGAPGRPALLAFATLLAMLGATGAAQTAAAQTAAAQSGGATVQRPLAVGARLGPLGQAPQDLTANCLQWVTAPASVDHSLVDGVCADVVSDLAGIGARLGLPVLAPTSSRQN